MRIIKGLLTVNPKERLTFEEIKKQPWIQQGIPKQQPVPYQSLTVKPMKNKQAPVSKNLTFDAANEAKQRARREQSSLDPPQNNHTSLQ